MSNVRETVERWVKDAAALGDVDSYSAKRAAKRYACHWNVDMKVGHVVHRVTIRDVSDNGIGIVSPVDIGTGRSVSLKRDNDDSWIEARVMHSTLTVGRFKLGALIQFEDKAPREMRGDETPQLAQSLIALARLKITRGNPAAAEMLVRECVEIRRKALPQGHWLTAAAQSVLGECLVVLGRHAGAETLLLEAYDQIKAALGAEDERAHAAVDRIINLYETWDKPDKVEEYRRLAGF